MESIILGKLTEVAQAQAVASQAQAVVAERLVLVLERIDDHLDRLDNNRRDDAEGLKRHIDGAVKVTAEAQKQSDRRMGILLGSLVMLAEIARAGLGKLLGVFR
jgi:hypothetical protein